MAEFIGHVRVEKIVTYEGQDDPVVGPDPPPMAIIDVESLEQFHGAPRQSLSLAAEGGTLVLSNGTRGSIPYQISAAVGETFVLFTAPLVDAAYWEAPATGIFRKSGSVFSNGEIEVEGATLAEMASAIEHAAGEGKCEVYKGAPALPDDYVDAGGPDAGGAR